MGRNQKIPSTYVDRCDICDFICGEDTEGPLFDCEECGLECCMTCMKALQGVTKKPENAYYKYFCKDCAREILTDNIHPNGSPIRWIKPTLPLYKMGQDSPDSEYDN